MSVFYHAIDSDRNPIFGNFPPELSHLIKERANNSKQIEVELSGKKQKARFGFETNSHGTLFVFTNEKKHLNSLKLFKELKKVSLIALKPLIDFKVKITKTQNDQTQELIHNLTSLNTYSIQDLYALIPQDLLSKNITKQSQTVRGIIADKPNVTTTTLLQLLKYNLATKVEFSVFEKTLKQHPVAQKMEDSIRNVILSILQIFIADFNDKNINVSIAPSEKRLLIDYDTLSVSLYYILENAVKYCSKNTELKILFKEEKDSFCAVFDMISLKIGDEEVEKLCEKNYRSDMAKIINDKGNGIGMYRILKTLKMNDATLEIIPRVSDFSKPLKSLKFEHNQFKIKFHNYPCSSY